MTNPRDLPEAEQRALVLAEAQTWLGTKYHHGARIKGVGVDCGNLLAAVFENVGLIDPVTVPPYSPQWHLHRKVERLREIVLAYAHPIEPAVVKPGDVVLYHWGHVKAHAGIVTARGWPFIIHAYSRAGFVIEADGTGGDLSGKETEFFSYW